MTDCQVWDGKLSSHGYAVRYEKGKTVYVARRVYEQAHGPIPVGMEPDHLCRNRACINLEHLEAVTKRVNILRGESPSAHAARRSECIHGHPLSGENLYVTPRGKRQCMECRRQAVRRHRGGA